MAFTLTHYGQTTTTDHILLWEVETAASHPLMCIRNMVYRKAPGNDDKQGTTTATETVSCTNNLIKVPMPRGKNAKKD